MASFNTEYFECECGCLMHNVRIVWFQDEWMKKHNCEKELYIDIHLNHYLPWYKRIYHAILYIFKSEKCKPYDCVTLSYEEANRLKNFIGNITESGEINES